MMKAAVFGANGQDGHYLLELLKEHRIEATGFSRSGPWQRADVGQLADVEAIYRELRPDYVFQLAASSTTRHDALFENHETISTGALNVLECARRHSPAARVFIAGSGVQFRNDGVPIDEETPFEATSPYGVARIQSTYAARYYRRLGVRAYVGYLFHHDSPLRKASHVARLVADAARRIGEGSKETLELGDISVVKEWTFAGDTVSAIWTLVQQDDVSEAVIGSGEGYSIEAWLQCCFTLAGLSWRDHVTLRTGFRPEYPYLVSSPARLRALGWQPRVSLDALAAMMMAR
jgi:GDPmannose 4,6-dehydratase